MKKNGIYLKLVVAVIASMSVLPLQSFSWVYHYNVKWGCNSKACKGFGICRTIVVMPDQGCIFTSNDGGKTIEMTVPPDIASAAGAQFAGQLFVMEGDFQFPPEFQEALHSLKPIIIKAGSYKMEKSTKGVVVYFN